MTDFDKILKLTNQFEYHLYAFASKKDLIEKFPEYQEDLNRLNPKYIKWLDLRFGDNSTIQEVHPIGDCISTLLKFQNKDAGISQKYNNNPEFKNQIDEEYPLDKRRWKNPSDPMSMTIDEMERILVLYSRPKSKHTVEGLIEDPKDNSYTLPTEDLVAKVGSWNIWLPSSRENSCKIAGYDPKTLKPFTTWCTARTEGSNLFYNYVSADTMLFYLIKDNPTSDDDWLSVGFINGNPILKAQNGGLSVNRDNKGLTPDSLRSILSDDYETIIEIMQSKNNSLDNKSPAQLKIDEAAEDVNKFKSLIRGNTESEAEELKIKIAKITKNQEVLELLAIDPKYSVKEKVLQNKNINEKILELLAQDKNVDIGIEANIILFKIKKDNEILLELIRLTELGSEQQNSYRADYIWNKLEHFIDNELKLFLLEKLSANKNYGLIDEKISENFHLLGSKFIKEYLKKYLDEPTIKNDIYKKILETLGWREDSEELLAIIVKDKSEDAIPIRKKLSLNLKPKEYPFIFEELLSDPNVEIVLNAAVATKNEEALERIIATTKKPSFVSLEARNKLMEIRSAKNENKLNQEPNKIAQLSNIINLFYKIVKSGEI